MPSFDGPYEARIFYSVPGSGSIILEHRMTFDLAVQGTPAPGTAPAEVILVNRDGSNTPFSTFIDAFLLAFKVKFNTAVTFSRAELWRAAEGSAIFTYITTYSFSVAGTSANPTNIAHQLTYTFRSTNGGIMRIQLMESVETSNASVSYAAAPAGDKTLMNYIVSSTNAIKARDNGNPYASNRMSGGQNEKLFRKRFRPT